MPTSSIARPSKNLPKVGLKICHLAILHLLPFRGPSVLHDGGNSDEEDNFAAEQGDQMSS
jgi:hypothetical protein